MGTVELRLSVQSGGAPLVYNDIRYQNEAGNFYSVTKFNFLMTEIAISGGGGAVPLAEAIGGQFPDPGTESYTFENVPVGDFDTLLFEWGAAGGLNEDGALPLGIIAPWPPMWGGGYHAMQFEGNWNQDADPIGQAFVMHSGHLRRCRNAMTPYSECDEADRINQTGMASVSVAGFDPIAVRPNETTTVELIIDVNGWMASPVYDLSADWSDQSICPPSFDVCTLAYPTMPGPQPQQMMQENASNVFSPGSVDES